MAHVAMKDKDKKQKQVEKKDSPARSTKDASSPEKKATKRTVVIKKVKQGASTISRNGDFIGRLGTLIVMIVTTINTGTVMVTSFIEKVWWKGAVHAALLTFIHIPTIAVMIWFMCKARMQSIYNKIRPSKQGEKINVAEVEDEIVVYEETVEVQENEDEKNANKKVTQSITAVSKEAEKYKENTIDRQKSKQSIIAMSKKAEQLNKQKRETKITNVAKNVEQINKAFDYGQL
ncbi:hypothetical protein BsWGS_22616 [Bradybaena similaris]